MWGSCDHNFTSEAATKEVMSGLVVKYVRRASLILISALSAHSAARLSRALPGNIAADNEESYFSANNMQFIRTDQNDCWLALILDETNSYILIVNIFHRLRAWNTSAQTKAAKFQLYNWIDSSVNIILF